MYFCSGISARFHKLHINNFPQFPYIAGPLATRARPGAADPQHPLNTGLHKNNDGDTNSYILVCTKHLSEKLKMSSLLGYVAVYNLRLATIRKAQRSSVRLSYAHFFVCFARSYYMQPTILSVSFRQYVSPSQAGQAVAQFITDARVITSFTQSPSSWLLVTLLCDGSTSFKKSSAIVDCWLSALRLMITYVSIACCVPPKRIYKGFVELNQVKNK